VSVKGVKSSKIEMENEFEDAENSEKYAGIDGLEEIFSEMSQMSIVPLFEIDSIQN